ncbi:MAG: GAF domain-containing protein [Ardenticatenales bacterium]|nr:GAF domain-containing protein [Ardenticatenales bacterium]
MTLARRPKLMEATISILNLAHNIFGLKTAFLAETSNNRFLSIAVQDHGGCSLAEGQSFPLEETYCSRVVSSGKPMIVKDARNDPEFANLATTTELNIGSYVGVPIFRANGSVYGTLCAIDPEPYSFQAEQVEQMMVLSRLLGFFLAKQ